MKKNKKEIGTRKRKNIACIKCLCFYICNKVFSTEISHGIKIYPFKFYNMLLFSIFRESQYHSLSRILSSPPEQSQCTVLVPSPTSLRHWQLGYTFPFWGFSSSWTFCMTGIMEPVMSYAWVLSPCVLFSRAAHVWPNQDWTLRFLHFGGCHE